MKVGKLLIFILNLALLGLLIAILIKKGKSEKFNDLELAAALDKVEPPISQQLANMELQIKTNTTNITGKGKGTLWKAIEDNASQIKDNTTNMGLDVKTLQTSINYVNKERRANTNTIGNFYSVDKDTKKTTLKANTLDADTGIINVLDMYPWTIHSSTGGGTWPSATLNFCVKDPANLDKKNANIYNPIFFKFDNSGNLGQVWANRIQSPGFIDIPNGPSGKTQWLGPLNTCPGEPPPKIGV